MSGKIIKKKTKVKTSVSPEVAKEISQFLFALGNQFTDAGNDQGAYHCYKFCTALDPKNDASLYNLATLFHLNGHLDLAQKSMVEAVALNPRNTSYAVSLSEIVRKQGKFDESRVLLRGVLYEDPKDFLATQALAVLEYDVGNFDLADELNEKALAMHPEDIHLALNRALIRMTSGNWSDWWWLYEKSLSYGQNPKMQNLKMEDSWNGDDMTGMTLLVLSDQGVGDAIQFSRYIPEAKSLGNFEKVVFLVQPDAADLIRNQSRVSGPNRPQFHEPVADEVVGFGESTKIKFDSFSSLLGIMRVLRISQENCRRPPHVFPDKSWIDIWKARIDRHCDPETMKVGLVWAGDPKHGNDTNRSMPLPNLHPLFSIQGVQLFSFQVGTAFSAQVGSLNLANPGCLVDLGGEFRDYSDTAAAIAGMDLIISVDTSIVHLAGCMGKQCWTMVPKNVEWRWASAQGDSTHWYTSVRIYRQEVPRDWSKVIATIREDLVASARAHRDVLSLAKHIVI